MWVVGTLDGAFIRESLGTRSWEKAESEKRRREEPGDAATTVASQPHPMTFSGTYLMRGPEPRYVNDRETRNDLLKKATGSSAFDSAVFVSPRVRRW
jgi:hypothetical protein